MIPAKDKNDPQLKELLESIRRQNWSSLEVLVITEGNSEQAKAIGIQRASGKYIGIFCCDNYIRDPSFLNAICWYFSCDPKTVGVWSAQYDYVRSDSALSRYFALLGANDPLCWWVGKADRQSYLKPIKVGKLVLKEGSVPSAGCNGFFVRAEAIKSVVPDVNLHFPMDSVVDLVRAGHNQFWISPQKVWHRSGESFIGYFWRRYVYARELYFKQVEKRRWHMVDRRDWLRVLGFCFASFFVVPHLWTSIRGYSKIKDPAWFLHPVVCFVLTFLYGICFLRWGLCKPPSSSALLTVPIPSCGACEA